MRPIGATVAVLGAAAALTLLAACGGGGDDATSASSMGTFDGSYILTVGSKTYVGTGTDYDTAHHREVIVVASSGGCSVRLDFDYYQEGRPASEVTSAGLLGFGGLSSECYPMADLGNAPGKPLPKVVVRNGRNEVDDGVLSGTFGFPDKTSVSDLHWSLRAN